MTGLIVLGASGRIGRLLRACWGDGAVWCSRAGPGDLHWDMLAQDFPAQLAPGAVVLALAGVTDARAPMDHNVSLALAARRMAETHKARHLLVMSSAAVYGPGGGRDLAEDGPLNPVNAYGQSKARMEVAVRNGARLPVTALRLGNVAGADALLGSARGEVVLDPVAGQRGPVRSYIGPRGLAQVLARLARLEALPEVLNIAAPPPVAMADLLDAAGLPWRYGPENPAVIARVALSTDRLQALCPLPPDAGQAQAMVAEWRSLGAFDDPL